VDDAAVVDFVRECFLQMTSSGLPLAEGPGLLFGFADLTLLHLFTRFGARLLARRRGATRASPADWNKAMAVLHRALRTIDLGPVAPAVIALYADLFASDDLPS
jgi:hypothetical protein